MRKNNRCRTFIPDSAIPSWVDLFKMLFCESRHSDTLGSTWCNDAQNLFLFSRGAWAMTSFMRWFLETVDKPLATVFLPDYFCDPILQSIRGPRTRLVFYPINEKLQPEWKSVEQLTDRSGVPDIFVLVHYFGFPCDAETASHYCRRVGAILLEDCAHVLRPTSRMGQQGQVAVYSPNKVLGVPDGGLLATNTRLLNAFAGNHRLSRGNFGTLRSVKKGPSCVRQAVWTSKKLIQHTCMSCRIRWSKKTAPAHNSEGNGIIGDNAAISSIARRLLSVFGKRIEQFEKDRLEHYAILDKFVVETNQIMRPLFDRLPRGSIPYVYPIRVDRKYVNALYLGLNVAGIPAKPWPDLPSEVKDNPESHGVAIRMRQSLILLPIHQSLSSKDVIHIGKQLQNQVSELYS